MGFHFVHGGFCEEKGKMCPKVQPIVAGLITFINFQLQLKHLMTCFPV